MEINAKKIPIIMENNKNVARMKPAEYGEYGEMRNIFQDLYHA